MAAVLSVRTQTSTPPRVSATPEPATNEDDVRSFLVHAAAGGQPLSVPISRARRIGVSAEEVVRAASDLRESGLLEYQGQPAPETTLTLRK
jgi:hypothetical protein